MAGVDKYGRGSAVANGEGSVDLSSGDTFAAVEAVDRIVQDSCARRQAPSTKHQAPKFSIIIPVYNVATYLRECLDSVLAQTFTDWEAICVDDGSTDGSGAILDEYAARDSRFRVIHQPNRGVSAARNAALEVARGEYITFLDGDDVIESHWLSSAAEAIAREHPDLLRMKLRYWKEGVLWEVPDFPRPIVIDQTPEIVEWGWRNLMSGGWSVILFVRRATTAIKNGYGFPIDVKIREDLVFVLGLLPSVNKLVQVDGAGYRYRLHSDSSYHLKSRTADETASFVRGMVLAWESARRCKVGFGPQVSAKSTAEIVANVLEFVVRNRAIGARDNKLILEALGKAREAGIFREMYAPIRWRLGFLLYKWTGVQLVLRANETALKWLSRVKRTILGHASLGFLSKRA